MGSSVLAWRVLLPGALLAGLVALVALVPACGGRTDLEQGARDAASLPEDLAPLDVAGGPDTATAELALAGHWRRYTVGDCINVQEWYSFGPADRLVYTFLDEDFCAGRSLFSSSGRFALDQGGQLLELTFPDR